MATDSSHRVIMGKTLLALKLIHFYQIYVILAGNEDNHILQEFEFRSDLANDCRVSCPRAYGKIPIDLQWGKNRKHSSSFIFDRIFFILAGKEDNRRSLDEFEFQGNSPWTAE